MAGWSLEVRWWDWDALAVVELAEAGCEARGAWDCWGWEAGAWACTAEACACAAWLSG